MDATMNLSVPGQHYGVMDGLDEPIFISNDEHPLMSLSNSPSLNNEDTEPTESLLLNRTVSMEIPVRVSSLLEDIQDEEVTQLKIQLQKAQQELNEVNESSQTRIKKVKAESQFLGLLKEQQQRSSMKHLQMNYDSELETINRKLMITQSLHVAEIKKMKKSHVKHTLETKLKDQKIKNLFSENQILLTQKNDIKNLMQREIEKLKLEFNEQMEREINKRLTQISQLKTDMHNKIELENEKNKLLNSKDMAMDEKDKLINALKDKIKELELNAEKEENMFFKHSEIMDYKLERETKDKKSLEKQLLQTKIEYESEIEILKKRLNEQNEINIHLQNNIEIMIEENNELNKVKQIMQVKETENKELRTSVNSHSQKLKELQNMLAENAVANEEKQLLEKETKECKHKYQTSYMSFGADHQIKLKHVSELERIKIEYNKLINDMNNKHELLQVKYMETKNKLISAENKQRQMEIERTDITNKLNETERLNKYIESSKVELASNFALEMDRIRGIIKKQNKRDSLLIVPGNIMDRA